MLKMSVPLQRCVVKRIPVKKKLVRIVSDTHQCGDGEIMRS